MIGVAGVRSGGGKLETRRHKLESEGIEMREPSQVHKNKEASERQPELGSIGIACGG